MPVGRVLRFGGQRVIILLEECLDVTLNIEAEGTLVVVPVKVNASVIIYFPVSGDGVVLFESERRCWEWIYSTYSIPK